VSPWVNTAKLVDLAADEGGTARLRTHHVEAQRTLRGEVWYPAVSQVRRRNPRGAVMPVILGSVACDGYILHGRRPDPRAIAVQ